MNNRTGILLVLAAAVSWSTAGLFTRVVTTDLPTTLFGRSLTGALCVLAICAAANRGRRGRRGASTFIRGAFTFSRGEVVIAALSTAGMLCFISAFFYTTIANVSFVYGAMPLATFLLAFVVLRERGGWFSFAACMLCALGVAIIFAGTQRLDDIVGIILALGMTFFMASLTIAAKFFPAADAGKATYLSAFLGAALTLPFASFGGAVTADYFWLVLYGVANVGLGFGVYLMGVQRVTAVTAALVGLTEIPLAPLWAWWLFAERPGVNTLVGGALILAVTTAYLTFTGARQPR